MDTLWQDLRYSFRMLWKSPGFTVVAIIALALGIGFNTAIFSVVNAVLLRPLPYKDASRLVTIWEKAATQDTSVAYPNYLDWRDQNQSFESLAAFSLDSLNLTGAGEPERLAARMTSANFFQTLGAHPFKGTDFPAAEDRPGGEKVVILGYGFWQRRFGGDASLVGRQLTLNNQSYTVIGVTAPDFRFGADADIFVLLGQNDDQCFKSRSCHPGISALGRLKPGVSLEQGRADMDALMARLAAQYPDTNGGRSIHLESLYDNTVGDVRPALFVLLGAVGFLLLIACANVANLLLARAGARQKEIAIRAALGAGRWRIVRQLLTESVVLGVFGGGIGLLLAFWCTDALKSLVPGDIPRLQEATIDLRVLGFTLLVAVLTGVVFGLIPALQTSRPELNEVLKEGDRGSTGRRHRVRSLLVVGEIAIALMLLIGAGLMVRSLWRLYNVRTGFETRNLLTMELSYTARPGEAERAHSFFRELGERIKNSPGVEAVAFSSGFPLLGAPENSLWPTGHPPAKPTDAMMTVEYIVTPDYFRTLGIELKKGRLLSDRDRAGSPLVAVIDESFAQKYFPGQDPLGKYLDNGNDMKRIEIVGIVGHVKHFGLDGESPVDPQYYLSFEQAPEAILPNILSDISVSVRTSGDPLKLAPAIRQEVLEMDRNQPVFNVRSMEQIITESLASRRFAMLALTIFAMVALLLAAVGIYGVVSYSVMQRTHEIGIRMALGASAYDVLKMVLGQGMLLVLIGLGVGIVGALALTRVMSSLLFGVSTTDPITFVAISLLLALVALLACYIPARRAANVDPNVALHSE